MATSDAPARDLFQLLELWCSANDERGIELLQHVAVWFQQQPEELPHIVSNKVEVDTIAQPRALNRLGAGLETQQIGKWPDVRATEVVVRVRRCEPVQVCATHSGET